MDYQKRTILPLKTQDNIPFSVYYSALTELTKELENFLENSEYMNNKVFSKKVMFTHEIKANNTIEGINDDVALIEQVIRHANKLKDTERRNRIINLYQAYKYILKGESITSESVKKLYSILSKDLLQESDSKRMGDKYRTDTVYILRNGRLDNSMDHGIEPENIEEYMNYFFEYINNGEKFNNSTDYYIKSQIMHFYFVYIHPYFDINGRTSRTIAMWYLLNNAKYPYIIFNRGINFMPNYDRVIWETKESHKLTKFLEQMLISVKKELEKEYIIHNLTMDANRKLTSQDFQTLEYFISMNAEMKTVLDFVKTYNHYNEKKTPYEVYTTMLEPLIEEGIIEEVRSTSKNMFNDTPNKVLTLNKKKLSNIDTQSISRLKL